MAANNFGFNGFTPRRHLAGGVIRTNEYQINTSGTTGFNDTIRKGDVVKLNTDGTVEIAAGADTGLLGVFAGCEYIDASGNVVFADQWTASTAVQTGSKIKAHVYDDPNVTFEVTSDATTVSAQAMVGANADFNAGTGSSTTQRSGAYLDVTTGLGSATANFRILGIVDVVGNTVGNTNTRFEVRFNEHAYLSATGI